MNDVGWIYIMGTSSDYDRCKIGKTKNNPLKRYDALRTADPKLYLSVAYCVPLELLSKVETTIHAELDEFRMLNHEDGLTEWFSLIPEKAQYLIDDHFGEWFSKEPVLLDSFSHDTPFKMHEDALRSI